MIKIVIDSKEIKYFIVNEDGKITESGEDTGVNDTFEDTFVDMKKLVIGKPPIISYNKGVYSRKTPLREAVWTELNYNVLEIQR